MNLHSEAKTRKELIDPALAKAGWDVNETTQVGLEIPTDGFDPQAWKLLEKELRKIRSQGGIVTTKLPPGICDYVLYRENGEILAVVEAKKTSIDPRLAQAQAEFYVSELEKLPGQSFRPFAFMTNGREIYFLDAGQENKREVQGFFSRQDLENLLYIRRNKVPLNQVPVNTSITDRGYQIEAIRRVSEAFEQGKKRRALITMATGTGKTRVAMSLVDVFLRANQAQRILFVADRDALVIQAIEEGFKSYIPNEPTTRLFSFKKDTSSRLFAVTLQTINNIFSDFTPAFFDLIIFDEVHRSIFNKWNEALQYFDGRMIGLTATPAEFIDRNTFLEFDCTNSIPTALYTYQEAVDAEFLVPYDLFIAQTGFQRKGIKGVNLTEEERNALIEQGRDPDAIDYSGSDIEKRVSNRDTLRRQWEEFWETCRKDQSGQLPGKTIVFAMTQEHALRLADVFEDMFPQYPGMVQVITYKSDFHSTLIDKFKKQDMPRIAISVDMLETGVNIPEVTNLVFMRPVQSRIKLDQMIGRGTRTKEACTRYDWLPEGEKDSFLIIDFWQNDFNKQPETEIAQSLPVLVTIFNTRLAQLEYFRKNHQTDEIGNVIADLRSMIELIPTDSFLVKKVLPEVERAWTDHFWRYLAQRDIEFLRTKVGPLLRYAPGQDVAAQTFTSKVERLKLQILTGKNVQATAEAIAEDVRLLPSFVFENPETKQPAELCLSPSLLRASVSDLDHVRDVLADQMKNKRKDADQIDLLDLSDVIETSGYIILHSRTEPIFYEEYKQLVTQKVLDLIDTHPVIAAIDRGEPVTDIQLIELERTLREELGGPPTEVSEENIRNAYRMQVTSMLEFLRNLLELEGIPNYEDVVRRQFSEFIATHPYNGDQVRFLTGVQEVFLRKHHLHLADLYDAPLDQFGTDAVERWFSKDQIDEVLEFTQKLAVR